MEKITAEIWDSLNHRDATWPVDPAVPEMPPIPETDDPAVPEDNWLATHLWEGLHPPQVDSYELRPRTRIVT